MRNADQKIRDAERAFELTGEHSVPVAAGR
jgi:hypothetical protein